MKYNPSTSKLLQLLHIILPKPLVDSANSPLVNVLCVVLYYLLGCLVMDQARPASCSGEVSLSAGVPSSQEQQRSQGGDLPGPPNTGEP